MNRSLAPEGRTDSGNLLVILPGLLLALMLAMLDNLIVGTSMPHIVGDLGGGNHLAWVVTAYTLATTVSTPLYGKLGDLYGRKRLFMASIVIFLIGSALSGLSQSMAELITFRAVQGLGAGGLIVGVMAIVGDLVPPRDRGRFQGYLSATMAVATIGGPLIGGVLTDHLSWRWSFYVNIPLGLIALVLLATRLQLPRRTVQHRIDYLGAGLLTVAASALVLVTTWGGTQYGWASVEIIGLLVAGVVATAAFLFVEHRAAEPILPLHLFRSRNFTVSAALGFIVGFVMFGGTTFLPFFQQIVQGASATNSGLLLLPLMLAMLVTNLITGQLMSRTGRYRWYPILGGTALTLGAFLLSTMGAGTGRFATSAFMVVLGAGMGFMMNIVITVSQNSVEQKDIGVASSTATFFRTIGASFGVSIFGAVFTHRLTSGLNGAGSVGHQLAGAGVQVDPSHLAALPGAVRDLYQHAVASAIGSVFTWALPIGAAAFVLAWLIKEVPLRGSQPQPVEPAGPVAPTEDHEPALTR